MTIHQLENPCWVLCPNLYSDDDRDPHYPDEAAAKKAVREAQKEDPDAKITAATRPLETPCWVVQCDGECEELIDEADEGYVFHHDSGAEALDSVRAWRWAVVTGPISGDELVYCETDRPKGTEPLSPSPAELEKAGQLRLPGVAS